RRNGAGYRGSGGGPDRVCAEPPEHSRLGGRIPCLVPGRVLHENLKHTAVVGTLLTPFGRTNTMSSALAMVLMAAMAVPGNGPEKVSVHGLRVTSVEAYIA